MVFNSIVFALFLPLVFLAYWFIFNRNVRLQNLFLIAASYFFYGWWDWRFLLLLAFTSLVDFGVGYGLNKTDDKGKRKMLLGITLVSNLSVLFFFKYFNFFADSTREMMSMLGWQADFVTIKVLLPVGISFYTFQSLSYTIDVYQRKLRGSEDIISFLAFVSFFPQLVAGPIERAPHMLPQFAVRRTFDYRLAVLGMRRILFGLFKKMVIADNLALLADAVFDKAGTSSMLTTVVGILAFTFQIYCDFSGYSDIALGTARLFGFDLMENFRTPYFSVTLREFWRRWHISLSTWFRDYVYIPLGGNKVTAPRRIANLFITFILSGLWHGAQWTFVIWGFIHWLFLAIEEALPSVHKTALATHLRRLITFAIVCLAWVFFRARTFHDAIAVLRSLSVFSASPLQELRHVLIATYSTDLFAIYLAVVFLFFCATEYALRHDTFDKVIDHVSMPLRRSFYFMLVFLIIFFGFKEGAPVFIYFKF
ncbi:MAG: rane bound O-acyl transferase family protein [Bacteroidetes bacterium]|nr:rane bound O-acyl transferase family protein [Bacteroidota bacterium]